MFSACCRRPLLLLGAASSCFKYSLIGAENALFYAICILSTIILSRRARDKHRNSLRTKVVLCRASSDSTLGGCRLAARDLPGRLDARQLRLRWGCLRQQSGGARAELRVAADDALHRDPDQVRKTPFLVRKTRFWVRKTPFLAMPFHAAKPNDQFTKTGSGQT